MKRLLLILILHQFCFSTLWGAVSGSCEYGGITFEYEYIYYTRTTVVRIVGIKGASSSIRFPSQINGFDVTQLSGGDFDRWGCISCRDVQYVQLPPRLNEIESYTFIYLKDLVTLEIPANVTKIRSFAAYECPNLTTLGIPYSVTEIEEDAFTCANIKYVYAWPDDIGRVKGLLQKSGLDCSKIFFMPMQSMLRDPYISLLSDGRWWCWSYYEHGVELLQLAADQFNATNSFEDPQALVGDILLPTKINGLPVVSTGWFEGYRDIQSISIPSTVTRVMDRAFKDCSGLKTLSLPSAVTDIGASAFEGCTGITSIELPQACTNIGANAFSGCCGITEMCLPIGVSKVSDMMFYRCDELASVSVNDRCDTIGNLSFMYCSNLANVNLPDGVVIIGDDAFNGCSRIKLDHLPQKIRSVGNRCFQGCKLIESMEVPNSCTNIGGRAFSGCSGMRNIYIGNGVRTIPEELLLGCSSLQNITLPFIGVDGGIGCTFLQIFGRANNGFNNAKVISQFNGTKSQSYYLPNDLRSVTLTDCETLPTGSFDGCDGLENISLCDQMKEIGSYAFRNCKTLKTADIPDAVTNIGERAFENCRSISSVKIPPSVMSIGNCAFSGCDKLKTVYVAPGDAERVAALYAFDQSVRIVDPYTPIAVSASDGAFEDCVCISWSAGTTATSYALYRSKTDVRPNAALRTGVTSPYNDMTAESGVEYYYWIGASTPFGESFSSCDSGYRLMVLTLGKSTDSYMSVGGNGSAVVAANASWNATSDVEWITLGTKSGNGDGIVTYAVTANETEFLRVGTITVTAGSDTSHPAKKTIKVTQDGASRFLIENGVLTKYTGMGGEVVIPSGVTCIGDSAFSGCGDLTSVMIPSSVTRIGDFAFSNCRRLKSVMIPSSVTSIGASAFYDCSGLESVLMPSSVTSIGSEAFYGCIGLKDQDGFVIVRGVLYEYCGAAGDVKIPDGVTSIGDYAFYAFHGLKSITIPDGVVSIGANAFAWCIGLTTMTIPPSVTSIGDAAFYGCSGLTLVTIPTGVTNIGRTAFCLCTGLASVTIPASLKTIGDSVFYGCKELTSLVIPEGVECVGDNAFYDCGGLVSVTIPLSVTNVSISAFSRCNGLRTVVTSIWDKNIFPKQGLEICEVVILDGVTNIKEKAFIYCRGLRSITLPSSVASIGSSAFYECSNLSSLVLPEGVMDIGECAFFRCYGLESVTIPSTVTNIGYSAFSGCSGLMSVMIPSSVTSVGYSAFSGCAGLTSVMIPSSVTSIGNCAFSDCTGLTSVMIPSSVTSIGNYVFSGCVGLTSVMIPSSVTSIGYFAFLNCSGLKTVYVDKGDVERVVKLYSWPRGVEFVEIDLPIIEGDEGATVTGDAETGFVIKPSEGKTAVEVTIPQGVDAAKVTVEVSTKVATVKPNGAKVKVVVGDDDITGYLVIPENDGVMNIAAATVKEEIVKEALDPSKDAVIELNATNPRLTTAPTRKGLTYTLYEGRELKSMSKGDSKLGDGDSWTPTITVSGGNAAFYSIDVAK